MRIGIAADHGGFALKQLVKKDLAGAGYRQIEDFGAFEEEEHDDYPDLVLPLAQAVSEGEVDRGIAICGSGVGAGVVANKLPGVRAALIEDVFSAHQGVEDDDMNVICLGGWVTGHALAWDLIQAFLHARFSGAARHKRRLAKIEAIEQGKVGKP